MNLRVEYGMTHLLARNPETSFPTGECGQMGEELNVTDNVAEITCPQCRKIWEQDIFESGAYV